MSNLMTITDTLYGTVCTVASLAPGASATCTKDYTVTQANFDAGNVLIDSAVATAKKLTSNTAGVTITLVTAPALTLTKTASPAAPPTGQITFTLPQSITYTYSLTNSGNVTLTAPFVVTDDKLGVVCNVTTGTLARNATLACPNKIYPLTQADLDAGSVTNHATGTAVFSGQTITSGQVTVTVITYTGPRITLIKTSNPTFFTAANQTITYTYTFKNTGGVAITVNSPYILTDNKVGSIAQSAVCKTATYTTTAADVTAGRVINTVSPASGTTTPLVTIAGTSLTVPLFICTTNTIKGSGVIGSGSDKTWTITNTSGLPVHIASITINWSGNGNPLLTQVFLNGISIWTGSAGPGIVLPGAPWTLNTGANPLRLLIPKGGTNIQVLVGFSESSCNFFLNSNVP
jgi:uncharacterized repeat protein (TIGR01451 family)